MNIRLLAPNDSDAYRNIRLMALQKHPEAFASSYEEETAYSKDVYKNRFQTENSFTFGAFENEELLGTVTLLKETKLKLKHRANIVAMYVSPEKRRMGIGKALIANALEKAKELGEVEQVYLSVEATNEPAKKLYESFGFEVYAEEKRALKIGNTYYDEEHMVLFF
ncbi:GNAT family N-acetyltransferase [Cytobacillus dafuensis]|uniref:GNAT family N-acetyltransferase n=1 Tax=Cytobacillus dafuensis TaxID=1742359 RepID=A0A5B8Z384_CYTDA|nr:GNAT family N-acetyltransferase [Cytobacillus dafuensis]QED46733.1 GNAT family N-acetyltransferase [Cytobacillus dafuensis]